MSFRVTAQSLAPLRQEVVAPYFLRTRGANSGTSAGIFFENAPANSPSVAHWEAPTAPTRADIDAANAAGIDLAAIPAAWRWSDVGLLASDMDSTLITVECIDEIADFAGVKMRVAEITERAMRGEIEFASALRARVALLKDLPASVLERVYSERVALTPGARTLIDAAHTIGAKTLLVSGGFTYFTHRLQQLLDLTETVANALGIHDGKLTGKVESAIVDGDAKAVAFRQMARALSPGKVSIAMGDGANDLPMLVLADLSVAYRAKPAVRDRAMVSINHCGLDAVRRLFPR